MSTTRERCFHICQEEFKIQRNGDVICSDCVQTIKQKFPEQFGAYFNEYKEDNKELERLLKIKAEKERIHNDRKALTRWGKERRVLIIDDDKKLTLKRKECLEQMDYTTYTALSGEEGLAVLKEQEIDLVVLDLKMQGMSGLEVLKKIKDDEHLKDMRVMIYTELEDKPELSKMEQIFELLSGSKDEGLKNRGWDNRFDFVRKRRNQNRQRLFFESQRNVFGILPR